METRKETQKKLGLECKNCKGLNTYTLMDGTLVCRTCGHREQKK